MDKNWAVAWRFCTTRAWLFFDDQRQTSKKKYLRDESCYLADGKMMLIIAVLLIVLAARAESFDVMTRTGRLATTDKLDIGTYKVTWNLWVGKVIRKHIAQTCVPCGELAIAKVPKASVLYVDAAKNVLLDNELIVPAANELCRWCLLQLMTNESM
jgi:hypothetical protein